jgi:hypothetical protein
METNMCIVESFSAKPYKYKKDPNQKKNKKNLIKVMKTLNKHTTCNNILQRVQLEVEPAFKPFINDLDSSTAQIT